VLSTGPTNPPGPGAADRFRPLDLRFTRRHRSVVTAFEREIERRLRDHHAGAGGLFESRPVRLFPRAVDAALLGGLEALLGPRYGESREIQLAYQLVGDQVRLVDLRRDGEPVPGALILPRPEAATLSAVGNKGSGDGSTFPRPTFLCGGAVPAPGAKFRWGVGKIIFPHLLPIN
jgi:hypothetical protein